MRPSFRPTYGREYAGFFTARTTVPADGLTADLEALAIEEVDGPDGETLVVLEDSVDYDEPVTYEQLVDYFRDILPTAEWEIVDECDDTVATITPQLV